MVFRRLAFLLGFGALVAVIGGVWGARPSASAQSAPSATPVILVPPTRTPGPTPTGAALPAPVPQATRPFLPTNTPRPTPTLITTPGLLPSGWRWPYVAGLSVEPGALENGAFRVRYGMVRVTAAHVSGAERIVFLISANCQPPTILGIDSDLSDGASVPWLVLSREMDALITAVAVNGAQIGLPALPIRAVFGGAGR